MPTPASPWLPKPSGAVSSRELYLRLLGYVRPHWRVFAFGLLAMVAAAATEPLFPALLKVLVDKGFSDQGRADLYLAPLAIVAIFLVRGVVGYLASYCFAWVANRVVADLRAAMFTRLIRLPASYHLATSSSVPVTKVAYDVAGVASAATTVITVVVRDSLAIAGLLAWLLYLNWRLTLISLTIIPLVGFVVRLFSKRLRTMMLASQAGMVTLTQSLQETIHCQKVVKVFGGEEQEVARFDRVNNALRGYSMRQAIAASASVPITQFLASIALAIVVYVALLQSQAFGTTAGGFVSFITAMLMLLAPMKHLTDINAPLQRGLAAAESVFQLLDQAPEKDTGATALGRARGELVFDQVHFAYPGAEGEALSGIDLTIRPGETVALVGTSGGGKTTLASLVPRFFDPTAGRVLLDGHDIADLTLASLRANVALVSQEVLLFDDTVAANIAYGGMRQAAPERIEAAARAAHALDFIRALPAGFDTVIGEHGARLSGGQRQRIAIARAILKDAPVLILDEATSALDNESERQVQAALDELMKGRTTLVVAHRLSTIENADRIVVLGHGRVVEMGSHAELLARNGTYAQLYRLQFAEGSP
jgi:subfamily B ATP-binding cassette protein MsbA